MELPHHNPRILKYRRVGVQSPRLVCVLPGAAFTGGRDRLSTLRLHEEGAVAVVRWQTGRKHHPCSPLAAKMSLESSSLGSGCHLGLWGCFSSVRGLGRGKQFITSSRARPSVPSCPDEGA